MCSQFSHIRSYTSALFERTPEEIRMALDVYQQELNRLMHPASSSAASSSTTTTTATASAASSQFLASAAASATGGSASTPAGSGGSQPTGLSNGFPQDLSLPKGALGAGSVRSDEEGSERDSKVKAPSSTKSLLGGVENGESGKSAADSGHSTPGVLPLKSDSSLVYMPHSLHNILRPSSSPSPDEPSPSAAVSGSAVSGGAAGVASPLQRIASITNSLMSQPANPTLPQVTQRPMKAILPPITQQQFDTYQNLNTEDIVKKVKKNF